MASEEKPYDPTPGRLQKAKREGNVARSAEIATAATFATGTIALTIAAPTATAALEAWSRALAADPATGALRYAAAVSAAAFTVFAATIGVAIAANIVQGGGLTFVAPKLKLSRLKPSDNLKRMFSREAVVAAARALIAFGAAAACVIPTAKAIFVDATGTSSTPLLASIVAFGARRVVSSVIGVATVFAVADYLLVRARWRKQLKMSMYELRKEHQENEGDPRLRGKRRGRHRSFVSGAVRSVQKAAFVVTNPTHLAVALAYDPPRIGVPEILVMGADETAARIRAVAHEYGIPIVENVALARLLWKTAAAGHAIPRESFIAVAEIVNALMSSRRMP